MCGTQKGDFVMHNMYNEKMNEIKDSLLRFEKNCYVTEKIVILLIHLPPADTYGHFTMSTWGKL